ncbi:MULTISPECIES: PAS domain-containing protein [Bradyrhizobium]|uniref:histidine kinase n=2 Tax=Bradyrhizobium TaxID=374 RepID=A0ABY0Q0A1_9BRAD|nr:MULTISPECIES: PAS domain-containing protein [Bradyrhizobium]SDJ28666.1 PAS domain S-box-containing protein [Bradyrhizobium ottawaense]SEC73005.1 PAS domain S-box-containing protein [Bradyrhizobium lablabi]SHK86213.1 PAS domain S-box-containing protein [Bradyrhizobium lablabi]
MTRIQPTQFRNLAARHFLGSADHRISSYVVAVLSVAVAIMAGELVTSLLQAEPIASLMLCAVIFTAWFAGFGPALLAIALALLAFHYYLVPPINSFTWKHSLFVLHVTEVPRLILFSITSFLVACVISSQKKTTEDLRRSGEDLQAAIEDQKRIEAALMASTMYLTEAQRLSRTGSFGWNVASGEIFWSEETFRIFQHDPAAKPTLEVIVQRTHPEDRVAVQKTIEHASIDGKDFDHEYRLLMPDDSVRYVHVVAHAARDASGSTEFFGAVTDVTVAREAEGKLRRSEAYLDEAQRLSHTSSWAWDVRRREFAYRSPGVYHIFGFDPDKGPVSLQAFRDRIHPEDRGRNIEAASRAIREKEVFDVIFRIVLPDGSIKRVRSVGHTVINSDGDVTELIGTHVDVTEQFEAKEKLQRAFEEIQRSEDRIRLVIDTIPTLVWRAGVDGVPDFLNQPALDYTGLTPDQAEAGWPRAFHPDDKKGMLVKWSAIRASGMPGELEARLRRFDGEYRWFLFRGVPLRDESGNIVKWYGSSTDIEDRKRTENALRQSEAYLAQAQRLSLTGTFGWRVATGENTWSAETFRIFGYDEASSATVDMVLARTHPEDRVAVRKAINRASTDQNDYDHAYRLMMPDGSVKHVRAVARATRDASGGIEFVGAVTDVTATKRAEEKLHKAQAELAHVTRVTALGELTASIAHEVNQPLAAVVANAEACLRWLDRATPDLAAARRSAEWVINDATRASEVIRRVRALANKTDVEKVPLDLNDVVRDVMVLVQRELASHRVSVRMELAPLPMILGDRVQLQQVIINLVMNGIEAMQPVTDRPRELAVRSGQDEARHALVSVTDCGIGIAADNANRLFNAFFTTKSSGLGMGLSICRSIVEAHGGRLMVSRNEGPGATFQLALPAHQEDA